MSNRRLIVAGLVGGMVMFVWGAVSHMALPIGEMGLRSLPAPAEALLLPQLKVALNDRGFYFFPGMEPNASEAAQKEWEQRYQAGPRGVLIFDPLGGRAMAPTQLGLEFASNAAAALLAAVILVRIQAGVLVRALLATGMGVFAWLSIDVSYWNWYRFPTAFATAQLIDQSIGWFVAGLAIALVLGRRPVAAAT